MIIQRVRNKTATALIFCLPFHKETANPKVYTVILKRLIYIKRPIRLPYLFGIFVCFP
jgi:hypothetical protein